MRIELAILIIISFTGCDMADKRSVRQKKDSLPHQIDTTVSNANKIDEAAEIDPYDSLAKAYVDTSTLKGKRQSIMNQFLSENRFFSPEYDTVFDVTFDGFKDYVIGYYGQSGTGIKNKVKVYLYSPERNCYALDTQLSNLPNPTFYIKKKKITGFYIGNGGGSGSRLQWIGRKWVTTKQFEVENEGDTSKWIISFPLKNKSQIAIRPYQMLPPEDVLETHIKW